MKRALCGLFVVLSAWAGHSCFGSGPVLPGSERVLFVRGADRSGGFLSAGNDAQRTERLADINNMSMTSPNQGWFELAELLRGAGYVVEQVSEPLEVGAPPAGLTSGSPLALESLVLAPAESIDR